MALFLSLCAFLSLTLAASQIEQRIFRRRAELLLSEVQSLKLRETTWHDAQAQFQHWGANRRLHDDCNEHACSLKITLDELALGYLSGPNAFVDWDNYFRWRLKLSTSFRSFENALDSLCRAYMRVGGRPARIVANIGMRDGLVWSEEVSVSIETYARNGPWTSSNGGPVEYTLMADVHSVPRFDFYETRENDPQLAIHPDYAIGRPGGCEICVLVWAKFTPYAAPEDINRLMRLDLSCLSRWHPCLVESDIMPVAWAQYLAERPRVNGTSGPIACPSSINEMVGRDSAHIAIGELVEYREGIAKVRVLERLKGVPDWKVGEIRDVPISSGVGKANLKIRARSQLILIAGRGHLREMRIDPGYDCPILSMNEATLAQLHRGIEEDSSAKTE